MQFLQKIVVVAETLDTVSHVEKPIGLFRRFPPKFTYFTAAN